MANRYWVGGTATWDATAGTKWATSSGGAGGAAVPTAADDVFFDGSSGSGTITLSSSTLARSINCTGFTGTISHPASTTISIGDATAGAGNVALTLVSGMTYTLGSATTSAINFVSTSATQQTITTGGKTLGNWTINGVGSSYLLGDANTVGSTATVTLTAGTLDTGNKTCSWGLFSSVNSNARTLTMGSSSITITGSSSLAFSLSTSNAQMANLTITANTATLTLSGASAGFSSAPKNFNGLSVVFSGSGTAAWASGNSTTGSTVANLTRTGTAAKTDGITFPSQVTVTITNTLTLTGNSITNRLLVAATSSGVSAQINASSVSIANVDFSDINATGSALSGTSVGNGLGNTNITFDTPVTRYAVAAGNWSSTGIWSASDGGSSGASVPLCHDTVILNSNSSSGTISADMPRMGKDITCTGFTGTLSFNSVATTIFGNLTIGSGTTLAGTNNVVFSGRGSQTITSAGKTFTSPLVFTAGAGTYTLQDGLTISGRLTLNAGTLTTNNQAVSCTDFVSTGSLTRVANFGTSTVTLTSTSAITVFNVSGSAFTMNASSSTIVLTSSAANRTFAGAGQVYGTLTYTAAGSVGWLDITGSNTFNTINFSDATQARTLRFTAGTTTTVTTFNVAGNVAVRMSVTSTSVATHTLSKASGTVSTDRLNISNSIATGGAGWYAGTGSVDGGGNTGWVFTAPPSSTAGAWFGILG